MSKKSSVTKQTQPDHPPADPSSGPESANQHVSAKLDSAQPSTGQEKVQAGPSGQSSSGFHQPAIGQGGPRWQSGNTLASHLCGRGSIPVMAVSGKAGSCLPLVGSLQYRTLVNYMYWFPLPFQLPVVI